MSAIEANIAVPVDLTNPGQFFACCGLLELADRLSALRGGHEPASGWFEGALFNIVCPNVPALSDLLSSAKSLRFHVDTPGEKGAESDENSDGEAAPPSAPIELTWPDGKPAITLDWWSDRTIKPWAGTMDERVILRSMLDAINQAKLDLFNDVKVARYGKMKAAGEKREPFYFDPRRGNKSHPLDCGFSPDANKMRSDCCPALEALCFIGLQRARPRHLGGDRSRYTAWQRTSTSSSGLPPPLVGPIVSGAVRIAGCKDYTFNNYFRTDQRKHKAYSQAVPQRSKNA